MIVNLPLCNYYRHRKTKSALIAFYKRQKYIQECHDEDEAILQRDHDDHQRENQEQRDSKARWDDILAKATLGINVIMIFAKLFAAYLSHSMSIISSVVDSLMDITSGAVIWGTLRSIDKTNPYEYPIGRTRLEPLAVLIVALIMVFANVMVIYEATMAIINDTLNPIVDIETLIILLTGTAIKSVLYILCRRQKTLSSKLLAQDQLNDVITNIVALAGAYCGHQFWKYWDPIGAYLVSGYIIINWLGTAREQIPLLIGRTATQDFINRISRIAISHHEKILALDMVYAYHLGQNFLVEIHVLMDGSLTLVETHDISESLQTKVERLPYVERAFVHCDYKLDGDEHLKKFN
uniref:Cation efflux protein cytoplasmic domain-containing protein n=1 Tax=Panagrolaimus superbus TaxID=310955 RepID=A0A914YYZ3_9BILA